MTMLHIIVYGETIAVNPDSLECSLPESRDYKERYSRYRDMKWLRFCRKHNFHPYKDAHGKIYELYLQLCAEGLI